MVFFFPKFHFKKKKEILFEQKNKFFFFSNQIINNKLISVIMLGRISSKTIPILLQWLEMIS